MIELHTPAEAARWLRDRVTGALQTDSRKVRPGDGFIAWPGAATDGREYVGSALRQGATACLVERAGVSRYGFAGEAIATYAALKAATGPLASVYFDEPSSKLDVIAVTGTNGKTSTTWWLAQALSNLEHERVIPCGVVGTLGIGRPPDVEWTGLTTPDPVLLQAHFRRFVDGGLKACAIEASSIGIAERRLDGTQIKVAVFTNFTQDHLDYHGSMAAYWQAKKDLFDWPGLQAVVLNLDDSQGASLAKALVGGPLVQWTYSCIGEARLQAREIGYDRLGLHFVVVEGAETHLLRTSLIGQFNVSNLLGVIGAMRALGVPLSAAIRACRTLLPVPGRMDCVAQPGQPLVAVDYAHTPDALEKALTALHPLAQERQGRLWCVFGCGGDRDPGKRPLMGAIAEKYADHLVITSDNPRSESPHAIITQILKGLHGAAAVSIEPDRAAAIAFALSRAEAQDVVLLAGKGHEDYQEAGGVKRPFSDKHEALSVLQSRSAAAGKAEGAQA